MNNGDGHFDGEVTVDTTRNRHDAESILDLFLQNKNFINELCIVLKPKDFNIWLLDVNLITNNFDIIYNPKIPVPEFFISNIFTLHENEFCIKIVENNEMYIFLSDGLIEKNKLFIKQITPLLYCYRNQNKQVSLGTTLMSNISHEIRTPLNGIITTGKLLSETHLNETQRDYMNIISNSCLQLLGLVNDILDISKLENKTMTLNESDFSLREVIEDCMEMNRDKIYEKNLDINLFIENIPHDVIKHDKRRLMQILINLINNAIKFTEKGNIIIKVTSTERENIVIDVCDTGIGINEIDQYKLFKSFSQIDSSMSKNYEGTGLGLAISKMLALKMKGNLILLESCINKGSTFRLTLPYKKGVLSYVNEDYSMLANKTCLIVDDNETNRVHISKILDEINMSYTLASSGQETMLIYGSERKLDRFDIYLIDIRMPGMNGNKLIDKLYKIKQKPCISLNSGIDTPSVLFNYNLHKPIIRKKLLSALVSCINYNTPKIITKNLSSEFIPSINTPKIMNDTEILIAEDNKINQDVIRNVLKSLQYYNFKIVDNGLKALNTFKENPKKYKIILLDIKMPILNGIETTKLIVSYCELNKIPKPVLVGLSANCMTADRKICIDNGMDDYLIKPIEITKLQELLSKY